MERVHMNASAIVLRADVRAGEPLGSAVLPLWCGAAWLAAALGFLYLDRHFGRFGVESLFATAWGGLGFGVAAWRLHRHGQATSRLERALTVIACLLMIPGFLMFSLERWMAMAVLLLLAARAPAMQLRGDLYLSLAGTVAVSLLVAVHWRAEWTVWFYLGPAWFALAMALAWDHASGVALSRLRQSIFAGAFLGLCLAAGLLAYSLVPRPQVLGFGFLSPPTDAPGRVKREGPQEGGAEGVAARTQPGDAPQPGLLGRAIGAMRPTLGDASVPAWQRSGIGALLGTLEALASMLAPDELRGTREPTSAERRDIERRVAQVSEALRWTLWALLAALLAWQAWKRRRLLAGEAALQLAGVFASRWPKASMRCSVAAISWLLHHAGCPAGPGESLRELVARARLPAPARGWLQGAVRRYGAWRFGLAAATANDANQVHAATRAAFELLSMSKR
jgi:hypothetical protein